MADFLDIANAALSQLGEDPIEFTTEQLERIGATPLEDPDPGPPQPPPDQPAETVLAALDPLEQNQFHIRTIYPQVKEELLTEHPWTWLQKRQALQATDDHDRDLLLDEADKLAYPFRYRWHNPAYLTGGIRGVYRGSFDRLDTHCWLPQGGVLFTDFTPALILWQDSSLAETAFPRLFVNALVLKLAARLAMPITYDQETARLKTEEARLALLNAKRVDSQSHLSEAIDEFPFVDARHDGVGGYWPRGRS